MAKLNEKALLVKLNISQWTAKKFDKKVTAKVEADFQTKDSGRFNKALIAQDEIKKITRLANEARIFNYTNTLPFDDNGARVLPSAHFFDYSNKMQEFKSAFENAVCTFVASYPDFKDEARSRLNGMYNESDYPTPSEISHKYGFDIEFQPVPDVSNYKVLQGLIDTEINKISADTEARLKSIEQNVTADLFNRVSSAVSHLIERLSSKDSIFRDSLIENIVELCGLLPKLNIMEDQKLDEIRRDLEAQICNLQPENLRQDENLRADTVRKADAILKNMEGYI